MWGIRLKLIVIVALLASNFTCWAQVNIHKKVTVHANNWQLIDLFNHLSQTQNCYFAYDPSNLPTKRFTATWQQKSILQILNECLGEPYTIKVNGAHIIILKATVPPKKKSKNNSVTISGTIRDAKSGEVLKNTSILEVQELQATNTDEKGYFELLVPELEEYGLVISNFNYQDTVIIGHRINNNLPVINMGKEKRPLLKEKLTAVHQWVGGLIPKSQRTVVENTSNLTYRLAQVSFLPFVGTNFKMSASFTNKWSLNVIGGYAGGSRALEIGSVFNILGKNMNGVQVAGAFNLVGGKAKGVQVAGAFNYAQQMEGMQISAINATTYQKGVQIGAINLAKKQRGFQIGAINIADSATGVSLGLVNWIKNGHHSINISTNEFLHTRLTLQLGTDKLYTVYTAGVGPKGWSIGMGLGTQANFNANWAVLIKIITQQMNEGNGWTPALNLWSSLPILVSRKLTQHLQVNIGPVLNYHVSSLQNSEGQFTSTISPYALVEHYIRDQTRMQWWVGGAIGVNLSF